MMNTIVSIIYDWNYIVRVNPEKNDTENTDDEDFAKTSSNSNKCDNAVVLD